MGSVWQDVRYALRKMVRAPGLTAILVLTLAIGIGASTTIFSVVSSVLLRPLPYKNPDQLARVYTEFHGKLGLDHFWMSPPEFADLRRACTTCDRVGAWVRGSAALAGGDRPVRVEAAYATHDLLPLIGTKPLLGRWFDASEDGPGGDPTVVLLGYDVWQRAFAGDPAIVGRQIHLDALPVTVIGVMPEGFDFLDREEAWVPLHSRFAEEARGSHSFNVVARVKDGASVAAFQQELVGLETQWGKGKAPNKHVIDVDNHPMVARPFQADLVGSLATTLWLLQGAVLLVLLISIVNVANLLLARSETRTREVAVRHALGASRRRLVRQFITESIILGIIGGALGILVAVWSVDGVTALIPKSAPRASEIQLDTAAVMFAVVCSLVAALLFGLAPIMHAKRVDLHGALKDGGGRTSASRARLRVRRALVIVEVALAVVLVIGCTVMVRSFVKLQQVDLGFSADKMMTFGIELPQKTYPKTQPDVFWGRLEERLKALPGVTGVAMLDGMVPARPINANDIAFVGKTRPTMADKDAVAWNVDYWQMVNAGGLEALGAKLVRGRMILPSDTSGAPGVVVVNEAFAAKFYPGEDAIGKRLVVNENRDSTKDKEQTIVGIVHDLKNAGIDKPAGTEVFIALAQYAVINEEPQSDTALWVVLHTSGDPLDLSPAVHRAVADLDATIPLHHVRTMDDVMWEAVARPRFLTFLLGAFAAIALLLAAIGIYGVMAHTVAQRTHEIGLRVALGARPAQVRALVVRQAAALVAIGVVAGLGTTLALDWIFASSLHDLFLGDGLAQPVLIAGVAIATVIASMVATWVPLRRALRVQPTVALRSE